MHKNKYLIYTNRSDLFLFDMTFRLRARHLNPDLSSVPPAPICHRHAKLYPAPMCACAQLLRSP